MTDDNSARDSDRVYSDVAQPEVKRSRLGAIREKLANANRRADRYAGHGGGGIGQAIKKRLEGPSPEERMAKSKARIAKYEQETTENREKLKLMETKTALTKQAALQNRYRKQKMDGLMSSLSAGGGKKTSSGLGMGGFGMGGGGSDLGFKLNDNFLGSAGPSAAGMFGYRNINSSKNRRGRTGGKSSTNKLVPMDFEIDMSYMGFGMGTNSNSNKKKPVRRHHRARRQAVYDRDGYRVGFRKINHRRR